MFGVTMTSGQATARLKNIEEWKKFKENAEKNDIKIGEALEEILVAYNNNNIIDIKKYQTLKKDYDECLEKLKNSEKNVSDIQEKSQILQKKIDELNNKNTHLNNENNLLKDNNKKLENKLKQQEDIVKDINEQNNTLKIESSNKDSINNQLQDSLRKIEQLEKENTNLISTNKELEENNHLLVK